MFRVERVNELLKNELAHLVSREIAVEGGLVTISYVNCSPDLRHAKIGVRVLPENRLGTTLKELRKHSSYFSKTLSKKLNLKYIPRFKWVADVSGRNFDKIEKVLRKIKESKDYE